VIGLAGLGKEPGGRYPTAWARSIRAQSDDFLSESAFTRNYRFHT
jgi:hypothetical protein